MVANNNNSHIPQSLIQPNENLSSGQKRPQNSLFNLNFAEVSNNTSALNTDRINTKKIGLDFVQQEVVKMGDKQIPFNLLSMQ